MDTNALATLPAPELAGWPAPQTKWQREHEAFQRLLPQLLTTYRGMYVVIHDAQVVDCGSDDLVLALRFFAEHGNIPIHIGLVTADPELPLRIPHYRAAAPAGESA